MFFFRLRLLVAAFLSCCATTAGAQVNLYVDSSRTVSGVGTSWATAYKTLNEALNVANSSTAATAYNVFVAKGTYYPTGVQASTFRDSSFALLRGGLRVYGGYPGGGGVRNAAANPTILSGAIGNPTDSADNSYVVLVAVNISAASDSTILDGFRVERGSPTGPGGFKFYNGMSVILLAAGGGFVRTTSPKLLFKDCSFTDCYGRALYVWNANLTLQGCTLSRNRNAYSGAAIFNNNSPTSVLRLDGCMLSDNQAGSEGGAIWTRYPVQSLQMSNSSFVNNSARTGQFGFHRGGAIYYDSASLSGDYVLHNVHFSGNQGSGGGALCMDSWTGTPNTNEVRFSQCSFTNNRGDYEDGGALAIAGTVNVQLDTCTFSGNTSGVNGGAIYQNTGHLRLRGCSFLNDSATSDGGAIHLDHARLSAENTSFIGNHCGWGDGGAIHIPYDSADFHNCSFESNRASNGSGGAVYKLSGSMSLNECRARGNYAGVNGGAFDLGSFYVTVRNTLISGNRAGGMAGGLKFSGASFTMDGATMSGDSASSYRGLYVSASWNATVTNSILWEGFGGVNAGISSLTYCTVQGGYAGTGNLGSNPLFVNPVSHTLAPTTAGDYSLTACSPSINAGLNSGSYAGITDAAGAPRLSGPAVDHGAYEFQPATAAGPLSGISGGMLCTGSSGQLTASLSGGTWSNPAPALVTVSGAGLVTSGSVAGTDTVMYSIAGSCPAQSMRIITVVAPPVVAPISGPASVCAGSSVQLANTTSGGVWSSTAPAIASVSASGVVTALTPGNAIVRYKVTNASGCADSVSANVTVLASPAVAPITGPATGICPAATLQLANATTGGAWGSNCSSGSLTVSGSGLVSGIAAGACSVSYTVTGSNGCSTAVAYGVTIYPQPAAPTISGATTVCIGTPVSLSATPAGGTWGTANGATATITGSGTLSGVSAGNTSVTYTYVNANGCTGTGSAAISVSAPAATALSANLCGGSGVYIHAGQVLSAPGTYQDTFSTSAGCDSVVTLTLTPSSATPTPDTSIAQTASGLSANASGTGITYQWVRCEPNGAKTLLTSATAQLFTPSVVGNYAVIVTSGGCSAMSGCRYFDPATLRVDPLGIAGWQVFPNPATDRVTVRSISRVAHSITLLDATGKNLLELVSATAETEVPLHGRAPGLYLLRVCDVAGGGAVFPVSVVR